MDEGTDLRLDLGTQPGELGGRTERPAELLTLSGGLEADAAPCAAVAAEHVAQPPIDIAEPCPGRRGGLLAPEQLRMMPGHVGGVQEHPPTRDHVHEPVGTEVAPVHDLGQRQVGRRVGEDADRHRTRGGAHDLARSRDGLIDRGVEIAACTAWAAGCS